VLKQQQLSNEEGFMIKCKKMCYAKKGNYNLKFVKSLLSERIKKGIVKVRIHESGDKK
jgi:hypothetical protein